MDARKRDLLIQFPWKEYYSKLIAFTEWVIQGKSWNSNKLPKGKTAENILRDVIAKTFSEVRNWDPDRGELLMWLKWVIRSEINHLANSSSNKLEVQSDFDGEYEDWENNVDVKHFSVLQNRQQSNSLEEEIVIKEIEEEKITIAQTKIDALLEACSGEEELEEIVYAIIEDKCDAKAQSLSEYLGRPVNDIYQNLRKLRRRAAKIIMEAQNEQ